MTPVTHQELSEQRAGELEARAKPFLQARPSIPRGLANIEQTQERQAEIRQIIGASLAEWNDWRWQLANRVHDVATLAKLLPLSPQDEADVAQVGEYFRYGISPYYLSLLGKDPDEHCPLRKMVLPSLAELQPGGIEDPMAELDTNPAPLITRRYPDRLIINVTNICGSFCRFCQRRRNIGQIDTPASPQDLLAALQYIREHSAIRDVLVTGGDPLTLSDAMLEWILGELRKIPHVEIVRIGSRVPATLPQRITPELCQMLSKYHPLYINTHFNHPLEITADARLACERLAAAGISLGNQAVLLAGVNNDPFVMRSLGHELLRIRVRPYYLFHPKQVIGTGHFSLSVREGVRIMQSLRGNTSGMAIPTYIVNAPGGLGKIVLTPDAIDTSEGPVWLRTWEGKLVQVE